MKNLIGQVIRGGLLLISIVSFVYLAYGRENPDEVRVTDSPAWSRLANEIRLYPEESPQDSLDKEMQVIQKFLKEHDGEARVGFHDPEVFRAIDHVRTRLQKADKALERLQNELSHTDVRAGTEK
jgi:hypothetical protein